MFKKILIANRGEIACRIMRTAKRMGIATVAVYSEADSNSLHVGMADEAVPIGPAPPRQSYLIIDAIVDAAKATAAEAIHPGYGFLSENPNFAKTLDAADLVFIGPGARAIGVMGDKIESKKLAHAAGVNTIPGHEEAVEDAEQAIGIARDIGYPVMLKASAGGGGKGMRIANSDEDVRVGFAAAASEARGSFGDDRLLIEKFIVEPRHIEVQILADQHGHIVHLGERECSIQRRHQKVVEEAPSPFIDSATRDAMGAQAVALARAVQYQSAGTVEFIVDKNGRFYFLEMNTRLQVEHPVTEYVTGLDIVELMIRIAAGEPLSFDQGGVELKGWALEVRIYAEDPERNFVPSTGRLSHYRPPPQNDHVRLDSGVCEGSEIGMYYDPLMAKLITGGASREQAIARMSAALDEYCVRGVSHNIPFLAALVANAQFQLGDVSTSFVEQQYPNGFRSRSVVLRNPRILLVVASWLHHATEQHNVQISDKIPGTALRSRQYVVVSDDNEYAASVSYNGAGAQLEIDGEGYAIASAWTPGELVFRGRVNKEPVSVQVQRTGVLWRLTYQGHTALIGVFTPTVAALRRLMPVKEAADLSKFLLAPMPGLLVRVCVADGDVVSAGQELAVVEAMKMENALRAEQDGKVAQVLAASGDTLDVDQPILEFE